MDRSYRKAFIPVENAKHTIDRPIAKGGVEWEGREGQYPRAQDGR